MKRTLFFIISLSILIGFTSVKPSDDLKMDWSRITDKDYVVTYVRVQYDSSSQYAIDTKQRIYNTNDGSRVFSKASVKLIKELITNKDNFSDERMEDVCKSFHFPNAIVVTRFGEITGIINIGCQQRVLSFEPSAKFGETLVLNEKGLKLKQELFK